MPTGYTEQLERMEFDIKRWLKESIVRSMGVCASLRDCGTLTEKEIEEKLRENNSSKSSYHAKALHDAIKELEKCAAKTDADWEKEYLDKRTKANENYNQRCEEFNRKKKQHQDAFHTLERMYHAAQSEDELIRNSIRYAAEQVHTVLNEDFSRSPYLDSIMSQSKDTYVSNIKHELQRRIEYNSKELAKENNGDIDKYSKYLSFVKFVDGYKENTDGHI